MKIIAASDIHLRETTPVSRTDDFFRAQKRKLHWLCKTAREHNAIIVSGGDVFDSAAASHNLVKEYIQVFLTYGVKLYTVFGQHDLRHHVYKSHANTPLSVLLTAMQLKHLDEKPFENDEVCIQGASWERPIPEPKEGKINILATHQMVTKDGGLWFGHTDYVLGKELLLNSGYDIVITGDNHSPFVINEKGKFLFNTGSLVRQNIDQSDYVPTVPLITVEDGKISYELLTVPITDASQIFEKALEKKEEQEKQSDVLLNFSKALTNYVVDKPNYIVNLQNVAQKLEDGQVTEIIGLVIDRVQKRAA